MGVGGTPILSITLAREVLFIAAILGVGLGLGSVAPRASPFQERDASISYALVRETVPVWLLFILAGFLPSVCIAVAVACRMVVDGQGPIVAFRLLVWIGLSLVQALAIAISVTEVLKNAVGRLRPNALAMCDYAGYNQALASGNMTAYDASTVAGSFGSMSRCFTPNPDAQRSFPSGHSSLSFAGLSLLAAALRWLLRVRYGELLSLRALLCAWPVIIATWIACSRIIDHFHHPDDVLAGSLIGIAAASTSWSHFASNAAARDPSYKGDEEEEGEDGGGGAYSAAVALEEGSGALAKRGGPLASRRWLPTGLPGEALGEEPVAVHVG